MYGGKEMSKFIHYLYAILPPVLVPYIGWNIIKLTSLQDIPIDLLNILNFIIIIALIFTEFSLINTMLNKFEQIRGLAELKK
jgi:hypothetical protein